MPAMAAIPTALSAARFRAKAGVLQLARVVRDLRGGVRTYRRGEVRPGDVLLAESTGSLWGSGGGVNPGERGLTLGKVQNLRGAARRIDGVVVPAGAVFSFWRHVGRATRRAGYVRGRERAASRSRAPRGSVCCWRGRTGWRRASRRSCRTTSTISS